jgi:hypothetical protein
VDAPFSVSQGYVAGYSRGDLRNRRWNSSVYGVRAASPALTLDDRCRSFAIRMPPTAFFSHVTAALLHSVPVPWRLESSSALDIAVPAPLRAPHARGIKGHAFEVAAGDVVERRGIRVTSPARTWCDLATRLSLSDLVAAGDFLIHWRLPIVDPAALRDCAERFVRRPGIGLLRRALELLDDHAESPPESILRVLIVEGGLPRPAINHSIVETETGHTVRPDFMFRDRRSLIEYQGDYHRSKQQWRKDMTRRSRLEADRWKVMEINWDDLKDPVELIARIRRLLAR